MRKGAWLVFALSLALALGIGRIVAQGQFGTAAEVKAMLERAVA
jgi:hypothetical protein